MPNIIINKDKFVGKIKPMHCVNNFFAVGDGMNDLFQNLKIPYSRLHDTASLNKHLVDIYAVFPDFDADENLESSYDFTFTDMFINRLHRLGTKAYYRLGVTIENNASIKAYHIYPPKDYAKWARICEHIIMHYNEGWANGFHLGIEYWEIWNEPENGDTPETNTMWKGTFDEFIKFYEIASNHLKNRFPNLKIGGYGASGFYAIFDNMMKLEETNVQAFYGYLTECFEKFIKYFSVDGHKAPLDFFSFHSYTHVERNVAMAEYCRKVLDDNGFNKTEIHLNEWNPSMWLKGSLLDSSNIISNMLALQDGKADMLMYYDFKATSAYCGVYDCVRKEPLKSYYVFKAFSELYEKKNQVECIVEDNDEYYAVAAYDGNEGVAVIANNSKKITWTTFEGIEVKEIYFISQKQNLEPAKFSARNKFDLYPFDTVLIKF